MIHKKLSMTTPLPLRGASSGKKTRGPNRCKKCGVGIAQPMHACPYKSDMDNDSTTKCNCCDDCQYNCAQEV